MYYDLPLISSALFGYKLFCLYEFGNRLYDGYTWVNWAYRKITYKEPIDEGWCLL
jgi:hypothetical protein